ncbi:MAG: 3-hydroxyacyl-CoA dehydrogenase/enoyl-CoA hydratase family protein [Candidatus Aminicenantales bacterium]
MSDNKKKMPMSWDEIEILIVGAGTMGSSLTQAYAQNGFKVGFVDINQKIIQQAFNFINSELETAQKKGLFSPSQVKEIKSRILATTSYEQACQGRNLKLVIETATEDLEIKKKIFEKLDKLCPPQVLLASNTSSLDINKLARATKRPDKVVWMHFFYLPHKNRAGEFAGSEAASQESIKLAAKYMKLAGKVATPILNFRKGGAADVIFVSLLLEAARMVDEGFEAVSIEAAGRKAFQMPFGFLSLMDATGIPLGIYTMNSFSDASDPEDPLYKTYDNFFTPPESYKKLIAKYRQAKDKSKVKWISEKEANKEAEDLMLVDMLKKRFLAVAFMTATEVVEAGVVEIGEVDKLCQNAFLWKEGPFALMNKMGLREALQIVTERMELSHRKEINFPIPKLLIYQAQKDQPWPLELSPVLFGLEEEKRAARITISNPRRANSLDSTVFDKLEELFNQAEQDEKVEVIIFDSAPIRTFIAGANVVYFLRHIKEGNFQKIKEETARWQRIIFQQMTGRGKAKIAVVDGSAYGGGVEIALAFALDPASIVVITERTNYSFPETRLGIFPGLRGTLTLPQLIFEKTEDEALAVSLSRYLILSGGAVNLSPQLIRHLGLADFLVPARSREDVVEILAKAIINNKGQVLPSDQLEMLAIEELPAELSPAEKEEMNLIKDIFQGPDLVANLYSYARNDKIISWTEKIARKIVSNSPQAIQVADWLIRKGFSDYLEGKSLEERADWELNYYLIKTFQHPDALEGLTALLARRKPQFGRQ